MNLTPTTVPPTPPLWVDHPQYLPCDRCGEDYPYWRLNVNIGRNYRLCSGCFNELQRREA